MAEYFKIVLTLLFVRPYHNRLCNLVLTTINKDKIMSLSYIYISVENNDSAV